MNLVLFRVWPTLGPLERGPHRFAWITSKNNMFALNFYIYHMRPHKRNFKMINVNDATACYYQTWSGEWYSVLTSHAHIHKVRYIENKYGELRNQDKKLWDSVKKRPHALMVIIVGEINTMIQKDSSKFSDEDIKKMEIDSKAFWLIRMSIPNTIIHGLRNTSQEKVWNGHLSCELVKYDIRSIERSWYQANNLRTQSSITHMYIDIWKLEYKLFKMTMHTF